MRTRQRVLSMAVALAVTLVFTSVAQPNQITNPGFETGTFSGWTQSGNLGFTGVGSAPVHSGAFAAFLGPIGSLGFLSQTIATTPGATYDLSFFLRSDGLTANEFLVRWNGTSVFDQFNLPAFGYTGKTFSGLVATGATTTLAFGFRNDPGFLHLDDISVNAASVPNPTPEPATLLLLGTTAVGIGLVRRRQRRLRQPATGA